MRRSDKLNNSIIKIAFVLCLTVFIYSVQDLSAQKKGTLIYPEITTALRVDVPNKAYQTKDQIVDFLIAEVKRRKVDSPLTEDIEQLLRESGADDRLIQTIKNNVTANLKHIDAAFYGNRGGFFSSRGFKKQALHDYQRAIDLDSNFTAAYTNRGNYYLNIKEYDKAIADFTKYIEIINKSGYVNKYTNKYFAFEGYYYRGTAYQNKGEYDKAIKDYTKFIELSTNFDADIINKSYSKVSSAYFGRAYSYGQMDNYDAAIKDYTKYISVETADSNAYNNRGLMYEIQKNYQRAIEDYRKALQIEPNHEFARKSLERVLAKAK
jgi:tetratricopeptide (TPR) repeat protein